MPGSRECISSSTYLSYCLPMLFCSVHVLKCLAPDPARGAQRCCPDPGWIKWGHCVAGEGKEAGDNRGEQEGEEGEKRMQSSLPDDGGFSSIP